MPHIGARAGGLLRATGITTGRGPAADRAGLCRHGPGTGSVRRTVVETTGQPLNGSMLRHAVAPAPHPVQPADRAGADSRCLRCAHVRRADPCRSWHGDSTIAHQGRDVTCQATIESGRHRGTWSGQASGLHPGMRDARRGRQEQAMHHGSVHQDETTKRARHRRRPGGRLAAVLAAITRTAGPGPGRGLLAVAVAQVLLTAGCALVTVRRRRRSDRSVAARRSAGRERSADRRTSWSGRAPGAVLSPGREPALRRAAGAAG